MEAPELTPSPAAAPPRLTKYLREAWSFPADAARAWRRDGWRGAWHEFRTRTLRRVYHRTRALLVEVALPEIGTPGPPPAGIKIRPFEGDWAAARPYLGHRVAQHCARNFVRGHVCLVAWRDNVPVGYVWIATRADTELARYGLRLPAGVMYIYDVYVRPAERGRGIAKALDTAAALYAHARGIRTVWGIIAARNDASRRAVETASAVGGASVRVIGHVEFRRVLFRIWTRYHVADGAVAAAGQA